MQKLNYKVQLFVRTFTSYSVLVQYNVHTTDAVSALDYAKNELSKDLTNPIITDIFITTD